MPTYRDYRPTPASYGGRGTSLRELASGGDRITELLLNRGRIEAEGARRGSDIWAGAIDGITQQAIGGLTQAAEIGNQERVGRAISAATSGQYPSATKPLGGAPDDPGMNHLDSILDNVPEELRGQVMKGIQDADAAAAVVQERRLKIQQTKASIAAEEQKVAQAAKDYGATLAHNASQYLDRPDGGLSAALLAFGHAKSKGTEGLDQFEPVLQGLSQEMEAAQASGDPNAVATVGAKVRQALTPVYEQMTLGASPEWSDKFKPKTTKLTSRAADGTETDTIVPDVIGQTSTRAPEIPKVGTPERFILDKFGPRPTPAQQIKAREMLAEANRDKGQDAAPSLTPQALDVTAEMYAKTGTLPPMGMGRQGATVRQAIINRAAELHPDLDVAGNKAGYRADSTALNKLQQQTDAVSAFEKTADKNAALLEGVLKNTPDLGAKFLNRPWRSLQGQLGSEDMAAFETIRQSVQNEYARIISNPNLSGTMSDSARKEAEALLSPNATVGQIRAALKVLKAEAGNRHSSYKEQLSEIKKRMGGGGTPAAGADPLGLR